jgi:hypothetical protein
MQTPVIFTKYSDHVNGWRQFDSWGSIVSFCCFPEFVSKNRVIRWSWTSLFLFFTHNHLYINFIHIFHLYIEVIITSFKDISLYGNDDVNKNRCLDVKPREKLLAKRIWKRIGKFNHCTSSHFEFLFTPASAQMVYMNGNGF